MGIRKIRKCLALMTMLVALCFALSDVQAGSGVSISYSPDGQAFTTNSGDTSGIWYENGTIVHIQDERPALCPREGEHVYYWKRTGRIPIAYWKVRHPYGKCIHNNYSQSTTFHGVPFGKRKCHRNYYSGWLGYCRDCGEVVANLYFYMNADTAAALKELQTGMAYYYLCPWCNNLEQGQELAPHICQEISANQYHIVYDSNGGRGYMASSAHMYNDAVVYEGRAVTPQTTLSLCSFQRSGYRFSGWNTNPDGTGQGYSDGERITNLSSQEQGEVTLYAQWTKEESILRIDPAGGSYRNQKGISVFPGQYGDTHFLDERKLIPPSGYTVSFDARGGKPVESLTSRQIFREWSMTMPFCGQMDGNIYRYLGENGAEDTVTARYSQQGIILPEASKSGQAFGGWYYDPQCMRIAGGAGSSFMPQEDVTLYAGWVELQLQSQDNYRSNSGKGAVDLSWNQGDDLGKSYKLYQRREGQAWQLISSATDIGADHSVSCKIDYTGRQGRYQVPLAGFYQLALTGAQGGNYGSHMGGKGGLAQGVFYLSQGEILTYELGGQNGYHGGGSATAYGGGGGYSQLSSNRQGVLLIAGGGGGATQAHDGMPGGSTQKNVSGCDGESGKAGGGGGLYGGCGGDWTLHHHTGDCRHLHQGDAGEGGGCYTVQIACGSTSFRQEKTGSTFYYGNITDDGKPCFCVRCGSYSCPGHSGANYRYVCDSCGKAYEPHAPAICDVRRGYAPGCGRTQDYVCGMTEGQVLASEPAYGGASYINTQAGSNCVEQSGWQNGDGTLRITSLALGYLEINRLNGVAAQDWGRPEKIDRDTLRLTALDEKRVRVSFAKPADTGTTYYHKVESYALGSDRVLYSSNVTVNTLVTQIQGYRYVVDTLADTIVKASHQWHGDAGDYPSVVIPMGDALQYLHIAAQDRAGNLGETIHIPLSDQTVISWPVRTEQIQIQQGDNVWPADEYNSYYVRAGEATPFMLSFQGVLCGPARADYQVTHLYVASQDLTEGTEEGRLGTITPARSDISAGVCTYQAQELHKISEGRPCVREGSYTVTKRSNHCRDLAISQKVYVPGELDGHRIHLTPAAAARSGTKMVCSDHNQDVQHGIWVIVDAVPPVITGMEQLEEIDFWEEEENAVIEVELAARDEGSGLAEFYVEICNQDNGSSQRFTDSGTGRIQMSLSSEDALFSGEFTVMVHAVDHVGNEAVSGSRLQGLSLRAEVERILEPHAPVFKAGESGTLTVTAVGYVDRIEVIFPEEMTALDPSLNRTYVYDRSDYIRVEKLDFMVPLRVPEAVMEITVRAYKRDTDIERRPQLATMTVDGNVLDELRTRLKLADEN
ncbi:MAG: InlB B-repeat-containing protein [bacterium]|nr:InlB B-repeat-containing protein [bacterium]MCM1373877.1 InlB B-repeat-containing protein [Muribaculum sp.]